MGLLVLAALALTEPHVLAAQSSGDTSPNSEAQLVSEVSSIQPGTTFTVGVHFELDPGWHNYWQNAGDSGLPTTIEWTLPAGFQAGEIQWPIPHRIVAFPLVDYGYSDEVTLLVDLTAPADLEAGTTVRLEAFVDWLICETICLPAFAELDLELPVQDAEPSPDPTWASVIRTTREGLPTTVDGITVSAEVTDEGYRLTATSTEGATLPDSVYFFAGQSSVLDHAAPQVLTRTGGSLSLDLRGSAYASRPSSVLRGVLHAEDGGQWDAGSGITGLRVEASVEGVDAEAAAEPAASGGQESDTGASAAGPSGSTRTLAIALLFAFFGGILLNLMPCVFPILSLKVLGAASQGGENRIRIRNQGLVFSLGVVLSFLALAGLLIGLRAGGAQLGWGFQLQSPLFVAFMAGLFFAIGLNLMGVFEVGASLTRVGGRMGQSEGYGESLVSGALATVIATPCTAPFMGAALGFALTRSIPETLLVFAVLGLGMSLPYLILSLAPGLLEKLPRPGPWMETLKQVLAFPMFATVIWLVWVFSQQTGVGGGTYLLSALLLVSVAGWMVGRWHRTDLRGGVVARMVSLVVLAGAVILTLRGAEQEAPLLPVTEGWQAFSQEAVDWTLAQGRPVFVDFTAAWCLTCQVNERIVLETEPIQEAFQDRNVALFKADWTRQDPAITEALEALGRNGVPVYALYPGRSGAEPHLLPAILTDQIVVEALDRVLAP
jgi:thiol:disulfide interchange protein DsbD